MRWKKLGRLFCPDGSIPWMASHAACPVAEPLGGDLFRIFFGSRDEHNRSSVGFVVVDLGRAGEVLEISGEPILGPGPVGAFDDSGCSIGCVVPVGEKRYLYYMGWHLTATVPWQNALGLAISDGPDEPFHRISRFPIVELNEIDPYTISYPWVHHDGGRFRMWYGSNTQWGAQKSDMRHLIKYAESDDGIRWERKNVVAVDFNAPDEYAMCKPCVIKDEDRYRMWLCARGPSYRICYAESADGVVWERHDDQVGIDVSPEGWDSEMIEYPCVFDHKGERYMLYNGRDYGLTGFGLAVLEVDD